MITIEYNNQTITLSINKHKRKGRGITGVVDSMIKEVKTQCDVGRWKKGEKEKLFAIIYDELLQTI